MQNNTGDQQEKTYIMINKENGARIECTEKYLTKWMARGFEVEEIRHVGTTPHSD